MLGNGSQAGIRKASTSRYLQHYLINKLRWLHNSQTQHSFPVCFDAASNKVQSFWDSRHGSTFRRPSYQSPTINRFQQTANSDEVFGSDASVRSCREPCSRYPSAVLRSGTPDVSPRHSHPVHIFRQARGSS